jgi:hypothetical protein
MKYSYLDRANIQWLTLDQFNVRNILPIPTSLMSQISDEKTMTQQILTFVPLLTYYQNSQPG